MSVEQLNRKLQVGGFTPMTTIDYPGELAAVVFCQGCLWRCRYCHNSELIRRKCDTGYDWDDILQKLPMRQGLIDAVVFSGGEPTLQAGLPEAIEQVRALGFKIGLHTAGSYPERMAKLLPLVDWVGLDIKALPGGYPLITGTPGSGDRAWRTLHHLIDSGVDHEVRITVHEGLLPPEHLTELLDRLAATGVRSVALQGCRWQNTLDPAIGPSSDEWLSPALLKPMHDRFEQLVIRP